MRGCSSFTTGRSVPPESWGHDSVDRTNWYCPRVDFRILGPLSVHRDGTEVPLPGARLQAVLLHLLVRRGENITADRLIDDVWGDAPPAGAANALQALISKLRRAFGAA